MGSSEASRLQNGSLAWLYFTPSGNPNLEPGDPQELDFPRYTSFSGQIVFDYKAAPVIQRNSRMYHLGDQS